jgi:Scaffold protein Nfu/NifU N terminal
MACARPSPTPNPDAMKFTLDIALAEGLSATPGDDVEDAFTRAVLAVEGVASVFGVNDFVTVTRVSGADWEPIVCAVEEAAATYLPACPGAPPIYDVERARALLREATTRPTTTPVGIQRRPRRSRDG